MKYFFSKILLIQTAFIGDVILSTAVIEKLKQYYPGAELDVLVKKENKDLLYRQPGIAQVLSFDKTRKYSELFRLLKEIRRKKYDLVINLHRFASSGLLTVLSGAKIKVGFQKNPFSLFFTQRFGHSISAKNNGIHEIDRNQRLIEEYTDKFPFHPKLYFEKDDEERISKFQGEPYLCIAPASVWFTKQFPQERWVHFMRLLPDLGRIYLIGGPADRQLCLEIQKEAARNDIIVLAGEISLLQSALLMKGALLSYVNDSAPLHLASAVNAPVCVVYCSTVPAFGFGPLSDFSRIVEVDYDLACRPCNLHGFKACPLGHFKCARDISLDKMKAVFDEITG